MTALLPASATKTSPAASTATPVGLVEPGADGQHVAVGQDLLDGVVAGVGDEDVAGRVHRHAGRAVEAGADGHDGAVGQDLLDGVVAVVGDEDVAGRVHRHAYRLADQAEAEPIGLMVPLGFTSLTATLPASATKTSPAASTATPKGLLNPEPMGVGTVGGNEGLVEYWNRAVVVEPCGLTEALSVAPVAETETAALVMTAVESGSGW